MKQIVLLMILTTLCASACTLNGDMGITTDPNTNGSELFPWLIEDLEDFDTFAADPNYWASGVHTKLTTNIDLSGRTYTTAVIASDTDNIDNNFEGVALTEFSTVKVML